VPFTDPNHAVPAGLSTEQFVLRPITADDAELDHGAVMETREHLRSWEQSTWPEDDFTVEANRKDLADLEQRPSSIVRSRTPSSTRTAPNAWAASTSFPPAPRSS
jgi:hypothetical protein